jgi:phosphate transport system substrate-binding protein
LGKKKQKKFFFPGRGRNTKKLLNETYSFVDCSPGVFFVVLEDKNHVTLRARVMDGKNIVEAIVKDPYGIGFSSPLNLINVPVKIISINNFLPSPENIQSGKYPIRRSLSLVTKLKIKPAESDFIEYCLDPKKGQKIIKNLGLVPTRAE